MKNLTGRVSTLLGCVIASTLGASSGPTIAATVLAGRVMDIDVVCGNPRLPNIDVYHPIDGGPSAHPGFKTATLTIQMSVNQPQAQTGSSILVTSTNNGYCIITGKNGIFLLPSAEDSESGCGTVGIDHQSNPSYKDENTLVTSYKKMMSPTNASAMLECTNTLVIPYKG